MIIAVKNENISYTDKNVCATDVYNRYICLQLFSINDSLYVYIESIDSPEDHRVLPSIQDFSGLGMCH